jgi:hypothetical protein
MGFFDGGSTTTTQTHDNPELRAYTDAYRGAAPWGFATLDPTASLAAMGGGTTLGNKDLGADYKKYLKGLSDSEKQEAQFNEDALVRIQKRQESGQFLTPQETEFINTSLDKAFAFSHKTGFEEWQRGAQALAGRQGLRTSDTPVAEPAMRELRNFELGLSSQRAQMGMGATLDFSRNQNELDLNISNMLTNLQMNRWGTRQNHLFGGGMQAASNLGYTNTTKNTMRMSGFQQFMSAMQMVSGVSGAASGIMGGKTPASSVGGSTIGAGEGYGGAMSSMFGGGMMGKLG